MPDKKLTDNEIIKALECCSTATCITNECPYVNMFDIPTCSTQLTKEALDLINRQKAEIDDLKRNDLPRGKDALCRANKMGMALEHENQELKIEVKRLQKKLDDRCDWCIERERTKAIKEFAKYLIDKSKNGIIQSCDLPDLVKEMESEN